MAGRCIWLDGSLLKACRVLRARLTPLGFRVVCRAGLPDPALDEMAYRMGCTVASSDGHVVRALRRACWALVPQWYVERKSSRDLATHILKQAARQCRRGR